MICSTPGFVALDGEPIRILFKLYPWEWIVREDFDANVKPSGALFLEPTWKMLLLNKGLLPILWGDVSRARKSVAGLS